MHGALGELSVATALESMGWNTEMVAAPKKEAYPPPFPKPPKASFVHDMF